MVISVTGVRTEKRSLAWKRKYSRGSEFAGLKSFRLYSRQPKARGGIAKGTWLWMCFPWGCCGHSFMWVSTLGRWSRAVRDKVGVTLSRGLQAWIGVIRCFAHCSEAKKNHWRIFRIEVAWANHRMGKQMIDTWPLWNSHWCAYTAVVAVPWVTGQGGWNCKRRKVIGLHSTDGERMGGESIRFIC